MTTKPKYNKNQRVYFIHDNSIEYGRVINAAPFKTESDDVLYYNYAIEFHDPSLIGDDRIDCVGVTEACIYTDRKSLVNHLIKQSEEIEKYFEKELRRRKK